MKKKVFSIFAVILFAALSLCTSISAFDGNDYDYGGGGGDWGGGNDWGGNDWGDDWGSDYSFSSLGSYGSIGAASAVIVIVFVIIVIVITKKKGNGNSTGSISGKVISGQGSQGRFVQLPNRNEQIQEIIRKKDLNFSADDFVAYSKQVFIDIENAWCARDLTSVRPVMHQNLYNTTQQQVAGKIRDKVVPHLESIAVNTAYLTSFVRDKDYEYLAVYLNARMIDYQTDETTGNIIKGDRSTRWDMRYKMKFIRTTGTLTNDKSENAHGYNCPNCGAPLEITSSGKCPYCGSVVSTGDYSWVLADFTTVRNDTVDDGIRVSDEDQR